MRKHIVGVAVIVSIYLELGDGWKKTCSPKGKFKKTKTKGHGRCLGWYQECPGALCTCESTPSQQDSIAVRRVPQGHLPRYLHVYLAFIAYAQKVYLPTYPGGPIREKKKTIRLSTPHQTLSHQTPMPGYLSALTAMSGSAVGRGAPSPNKRSPGSSRRRKK